MKYSYWIDSLFAKFDSYLNNFLLNQCLSQKSFIDPLSIFISVNFQCTGT